MNKYLFLILIYPFYANAYYTESPSDKASKACTSRGPGYSLNNISSPTIGNWYTEVKNGNTFKTRLVEFTYQCNLTEDGKTFQYGSGGVSVYETEQVCTAPNVWNDSTRQCEPPNQCQQKAGKDAGELDIALPTTCAKVVNGSVTVADKSCIVQQLKTPSNGCESSCQVAPTTSEPIYNSKGGNTYTDNKTDTVYMRYAYTYTGRSCQQNDLDAKQPSVNNSQDQKTPQSQNDCPSGTTFGQVQGKSVCVKNAPKPGTTPTPNDGKVCLGGDCKVWDVDMDGKPGGTTTDPGSGTGDGTGGGVTGDGQQGDGKVVTGGGDETVQCKGESCPEGDNGTGGFDIEGFSDVDSDKIYKSKYSNKSFGDIWDARKGKFEQTAFIQSVKNSFPKFGSGGSNPSYNVSFSALGIPTSFKIEIPPEIAAFIKACLIITACFTARKIIW